MTHLSNPLPAVPGRRNFMGRMGRMALHGLVAATLWPLRPALSASAKPVPSMDAAVPADLETATFGLG